jgi:4'-phosphopantetheinyl transferase
VSNWAPVPLCLALPDDEIHVWRASLDRSVGAIQQLAATLSADELTRAGQFYSSQLRLRYVAGRGLLRAILSRYLNVPPGAIRFRYGAHGKPALAAEEASATTLHFNLSHAQGMVVYAVARRAVGIDVEYRHRHVEVRRLARRFFAPAEQAAVAAAPPARVNDLFFQIWTRKEAFIKATGKGLAQPLQTFDVLSGTGVDVVYVELAGRGQQPLRWQLHDLHPHPDFAAALAAPDGAWRLQRWHYGSADSR